MMHPSPAIAITQAKTKLYHHGYVVEQNTWQSVKSPDKTLELLNHSLSFPIPHTLEGMVETIKPNLPWADNHFMERVCLLPLNPPPSHEQWPFNQNKNEQFTKGKKFSHTYPERIWPKAAGKVDNGPMVANLPTTPDLAYGSHKGIRFEYGDLMDLVEILCKDQSTRQAFLPIWFPEDLYAANQGERVPCTLGYHFIIRNNLLYINYYMRSCDIIRHFRDDIYLACRLVPFVLEMMSNDFDGIKHNIKPGVFTMHITSLHCFVNDKELLLNPKY